MPTNVAYSSVNNIVSGCLQVLSAQSMIYLWLKSEAVLYKMVAYGKDTLITYCILICMIILKGG